MNTDSKNKPNLTCCPDHDDGQVQYSPMRAHDAAAEFAANYLHHVMKAASFLLSTFHEENSTTPSTTRTRNVIFRMP